MNERGCFSRKYIGQIAGLWFWRVTAQYGITIHLTEIWMRTSNHPEEFIKAALHWMLVRALAHMPLTKHACGITELMQRFGQRGHPDRQAKALRPISRQIRRVVVKPDPLR